jgi:hypothetical protein
VTDLDRLEQLARAATPGPWQVDRVNHDGCARVCDGTCLGSHADCDAIVTADGFDHLGANDSNPDYIAAASPDVVLSLLAELRKLRRDLARTATERDAYRSMLCDLLASAHLHPTEHPTMTKQWARARELLKNGPALDSLDAEDK